MPVSPEKRYKNSVQKTKLFLRNPQNLLLDATPNSILGTIEKIAKLQLEGFIKQNYNALLKSNPVIAQDQTLLKSLRKPKNFNLFKDLTESTSSDIIQNILITHQEDIFTEKQLNRYDKQIKRIGKIRDKQNDTFEAENELFIQQVKMLEAQGIIDPENFPPKPKKPGPRLDPEITPLDFATVMLQQSGVVMSVLFLENIEDKEKEVAKEKVLSSFISDWDEFESNFPNIATKLEKDDLGSVTKKRKRKAKKKKVKSNA